METEVLKPLAGVAIPEDNYHVTVRVNEANMEELGLIYLHGIHNHVRIDLADAGYVQVVDLSQGDGMKLLDPAYPDVIYQVENSRLILELARQSQGIMAEPGPEAYDDCSHHRIILEDFIVDVVRYDYEDFEPIFLIENGGYNG